MRLRTTGEKTKSKALDRADEFYYQMRGHGGGSEWCVRRVDGESQRARKYDAQGDRETAYVFTTGIRHFFSTVIVLFSTTITKSGSSWRGLQPDH